MSTPSMLVAGRYRLVKLLGAGGMGAVWQAWDERLERAVALKMLRTQPELTDEEREVATQRAMREARISAGLHHPHAVMVYDVVEHDGRPCIVMQLVVSTTLSELLSEHGRLTPAEAARIGAQIASALAAAHELHIVHRDVKPGNILIAADGSAMISDFGISYALGDATITATGLIHGTPAYLAPEVARGSSASFASDVFSLGATLYTALEGDPPFGADKNAIALLHRVARGSHPPPKNAGMLRPLLRQMLSADPKRRPRMDSVAASLGQLAERAPGEATGGLGSGGTSDPTEAPEAPAPTVALTPDRSAAVGAAAGAAGVVSAAAASAAAASAAAAETEPVGTPVTLAAESDASRSDGPTAPLSPGDADDTERLSGPSLHEPTATALEWPFAGLSTSEVTEPLASPEQDAPDPPTPTDPKRSRRRMAWVGAALAVVAVVMASLIFTSLPRDQGGSAAPDTTPSSESTPSAAAPTPTPSAPQDSTESGEAEDPAPAPQQPSPEERAVQSITDYYAIIGTDRDTAWSLMTADYQTNHAGGRGGYDSFWNAVSDVEVSDVTASGPDRGQATLTYYYADGSVVQEVTAFRLVDEGGVLKIAATEVLSSTTL